MRMVVIKAWIVDQLVEPARTKAAPDNDGASGSAQTLAMRRVTTCDTCQYARRMSFRNDNSASGLMCLHDIHRFSSSRFPRDNAESA